MTDDSKTQTPEPTLSDTADDLEQLRRERDDFRDLLLRKTAELDNFRKRTERERASVVQAAAADLIAELLPLVDDLERALEADADDSTTAAYRTGVELIHKQLLVLLEKRGVVPIEAVGRDFDPEYHEAVDTPAPCTRRGSVRTGRGS